MKTVIYRLYCSIHRIAKIILGRRKNQNFRLVSIPDFHFNQNDTIIVDGPLFNEISFKERSEILKNNVFPVENVVGVKSNSELLNSFERCSKRKRLRKGIPLTEVEQLWFSFVENSKIEQGYKHQGFHYAGYIADNSFEWCLPSWIWTNAAIVRYLVNTNRIEEAKVLANLFLLKQQKCGGWIVRHDYDNSGIIRMIAPNDSAYIANNALLSLYQKTKNKQLLISAEKCAVWIMNTCRPDFIVWNGLNIDKNEWDKNNVIVDIGFTAGLFAKLFNITKEEKYRIYLEKFIKSYVQKFYCSEKQCFYTSINAKDNGQGGAFTRGQAWALEGLIPAYKILQNDELKNVINNTVNTLINTQLKNGGWSYNLDKPLLGEDNKGVPIIAKAILEWSEIHNVQNISKVIEKALFWCAQNTSIQEDPSFGGIFSYNMEGAIVHNHYGNTAFVYSSVYALELLSGFNLRYGNNNIN